ncbi:MAG: sulfatase [Phycisphaeraceae bacterium]|nr:sulfatase [Phycisphaeraceae bacterium]
MPDTRPPNLLWISFEDTNPRYGCYGDPISVTPNLDQLAAEGCVWPQTFSTSGVCAPARAAVITGMYAASIGAHHMRTVQARPDMPELPTPYDAVPPHYVKCFTEYLRAAGYYCTNNQKTDYQFQPPLTAWDELGPKAHWRNRPNPDQPFFAVFNPTRTHESGMWDENAPDPLVVDPDQVTVPPYLPDTPKVRTALARLYTHLHHSDTHLGRLLDELEADGLADNTLVMHWSDHGPLPRGKRWPYDAGVHVPMIARWPGRIEPGTVSDQLLSTIDLGPTVLSAVGLPIPRHMQGMAFIGDQAAPPRQYVYMTRDRHDENYDMVRAVRDSRFKYIRNYHPELPRLGWQPYLNRHPIMQEMWRCRMADELSGPQLLMFEHGRPCEELYDTQSDPHEIHNLADDPEYVAHLGRLRDALARWQDEIGDLGRISEIELVNRWYPRGMQPTTATPLFIPLADGYPGIVPSTGSITCPAPAMLQLTCATQGASIAWRLESDAADRWRLYSDLIQLTPGRYTIEAQAGRIGYKPSDTVRMEIEVTG